MEELHIQKIGSVKIEKVEIDDDLDKKYKPGLYKQVSAFIFGDHKENLITIQTLTFTFWTLAVDISKIKYAHRRPKLLWISWEN